ncbi:MAG: hypothetical protein CMH57_08875 [Myxococcales bacterium]|nr:hypothetical protein [Myxococcales bacterium]
MIVLLAALTALVGCSDPTADGTAAATECAKSDLIRQCPPGSNPMFDAASSAMCAGSGEANLISQDGKVTASCVGEGECQVLCQFAVPCDCDVERIDQTGVYCRDCNDSSACGDDMCTGTETPESCPRDCGAVCTAEAERCFGDDRQICSLRGLWEELVPCPTGERCQVNPDNEDATVCVP